MPMEMSRLEIANDFLKTAESSQAKAEKYRDRGGVRFLRSACHNYYYSAYHICVHLIPEIKKDPKNNGITHATANKAVREHSWQAARLLKHLKRLREWADYELTLSPSKESFDIRTAKIYYKEFVELINSAIPDDAKKR
jgi:hypothetical protein